MKIKTPDILPEDKLKININELTEGYVIQTDYGFIHVGDNKEYYVSTSFSNGGLAMFDSAEIARVVRDNLRNKVAWKHMINWTKIVRIIKMHSTLKK